ncbi:MAG: RidA family protein [Alphaproteobacteria bacterium]
MEFLQPPDWPKPKGYANGVAAQGKLVFVGGQIGWNPVTMAFEAKDLVGQFRQTLENIRAVLGAAGAVPADVVRLTWYITDRAAYLDNLRAIGGAYREIFGRHYPAMAVVQVVGLVEAEALVEIEATAVVPG